MTKEAIHSLRARVCAQIAALGGVIDSLDVSEQTLMTPFDPVVDTAVILQHIDEARSAADTAARQAADLATALDGCAAELRVKANQEVAP